MSYLVCHIRGNAIICTISKGQGVGIFIFYCLYIVKTADLRKTTIDLQCKLAGFTRIDIAIKI